jgi:hypothetical protein
VCLGIERVGRSVLGNGIWYGERMTGGRDRG